MLSKLATLYVFTLALLLSFGLIRAYRPTNLDFKGVSSLHKDGLDDVAPWVELEDESCEGVEGMEECLKRRTLVAHTDYIYTDRTPKKHKHDH